MFPLSSDHNDWTDFAVLNGDKLQTDIITEKSTVPPGYVYNRITYT